MTRSHSRRTDWWPRFDSVDWGLVGLILLTGLLDALMLAALCFGVM